MLSWEEAEIYLRTAEPGSDTDSYIEALCDQVFQASQPPESTNVLVAALERAQSSLAYRTVVLALALSATAASTYVVDVLVEAYRKAEDTAFVKPAILEALSILALRVPLARMETASALLRLDPQDSRYLLIKAAKIIGRLDNIQPEPILRDKLHALGAAPDLAVQSEVHYQIGLIALADALLAPSAADLSHWLEAAHDAFVRAEMSAEVRDDAALVRLLIEAIIAVQSLTAAAPESRPRVLEDLDRLQKELIRLNTRIWRDYRSPSEELVAVRILDIVDALQRSVSISNAAEDWTNFDAVLLDLATIHALVRNQTVDVEYRSRFGKAIRALADIVVLPPLGPVLIRILGRRRLTRVIEQYESRPEKDTTLVESLRALEQVALASEAGLSESLHHDRFPHLGDVALRLNASSAEVLRNFLEAVDSNSVGRWIEQAGLDPVRLHIDHPGLFGADPSIHDAVLVVLEQLHTRLRSYPRMKWLRLLQSVEAIVSFVHRVRDTMPRYTLCTEDDGLGQAASEHDLQEDLFAALRMKFGRSVSYEITRVGGGRPDNGLSFDECFFPIESKAEFRTVERQHIHDGYIAQTSFYAAASSRVAFLMVLDLRDVNAAGHVSRTKQRRRQKQPPAHHSLYTLEDGFWIDGLPLDPQLPHMKPQVVVVCLVPGNRPRPSSTTTYSVRPRKREG
jgi:hypothetical protein